MDISIVHTVVWQDHHFARLERMGEYTHHPGYPSTPAELTNRIGQAQVVIGADVYFTAEVLGNCPNLAMICLWSTGYDNVDLSAAQLREITISHVPSYSSYSVAEHAWAMVLHLAKKLSQADSHVRSMHFDWSAIRGMELYNKKVGIIGMGAIGLHSASIAKGFGCEVVAYTKHPDRHRQAGLPYQFLTLPELLSSCDIILLHIPLNQETWHLINTEAFSQMKKQPVLINTSRGAIIEMEPALEALKSGIIGGLGLDVLWDEPPDWSDRSLRQLLSMDQVVFSPHCGAHTPEAFDRLTDICLV